MKKTIFLLAAILAFAAGASAASPQTANYMLPRTVIAFQVNVEQEVFHAGPYARYAQKYLGVAARLSDASTSRLTGVRISSAEEADPSAVYTLPSGAYAAMMELTAQGLVAVAPGAEKANWRFKPASKAQFTGAPSNLASTHSTLKGNAGNAVRQDALVEKTAEQKAKEVADRIFEIRDYRYKILVGDTDATYSGEAMKATMNELSAMEKELTELFLGKSEFVKLSGTFEIVPDPSNENQVYVPFRISDESGPVGPDNMEGKPYYFRVVPEVPVLSENLKAKSASPAVVYRIPAVCNCTLFDASSTVAQTRIPVSQLGVLTLYPITK